MTNQKIAAAVALALGTAGAAHATAPTAAQCAAPTEQVFVAGSSAAQKAFFTAVNTDILGGNGSLYVSSAGNFQAICGLSANTTVAPLNTVLLLHYRAEGGSVVGALPLADGGSHPINFLITTGVTTVGTLAAPVTLSVTGSSATVGTTDGWSGSNLTKHAVDIGIVDIEPAQFTGTNFPTLYSSAVFGTANTTTTNKWSGLKSKSKPLVAQVFGLFVNTNGFNGSATTGQAVNLSTEAVANILDGTITDWSQVPSLVSGAVKQVSTSAAPIVLVNRESGSGSRTQASIYFLDYNCGQTSRFIADPTPAADGYATGDVLKAVASSPGGITYASIDQSNANDSLVSLNSIAPTNLAAAAGDYGDWFEAQSIKGNTTLDTVGTAIYNYIANTIPTNAKAPQSVDTLTIPNAGSPANPSATLPLAVNGVIYTNPYGRLASSCFQPKKQ